MLRPHQWVKNLFVLAPAVFARELLIAEYLHRALVAFVGFCFASSAIYIINDLADRTSDQNHPVKRHRPIASGQVQPRLAMSIALLLMAAAAGAAVYLGALFALFIGMYVVLNFAYTFKLKRIAYVDAICIATGFELRVLAGAAAVAVAASGYLLTVTFILALFLAFGKRAHELSEGQPAIARRRSLRNYSPAVVTAALYVTGIATVATYLTYTLDPNTQLVFRNRYLFFTTAFVIFGIVRFVYLIRDRDSAESPTEKMLRDWPFIGNLVLWVASIIVIIYWSP